MKLTHKFAEMTPEKRPQDPHMEGTGLRFETMEHGGEYPDTMPPILSLEEPRPRGTVLGERADRRHVREAEHYLRCKICGGFIDARDVGGHCRTLRKMRCSKKWF